MKLLVTSDLHLSDKIWKHRPIECDSYHSWEQIVELAISNECDAVILAGDLLDKQTNLSNPINQLMRGLKELEKNHIEVYYNQGQHELQSVPWMSLDSGTVWLQNDALMLTGDWYLSGCDYQNTDGLAAYLQSEEVRAADIIVCHQVWLEFMGELCKPQGSFADVPENVQILITGDYHEAICQKFGHLTVISPGSTHLRSISEPEDKSVYVLNLSEDGKKIQTICSVPLNTRRRIEVKVGSNPDFKAIKQEIEAKLEMAEDYAAEFALPVELRKPLLRLVYPQAEVELVGKVTQLVKDKAHLFFKQVKQVTPEDLEPKLVQHTDPSERIGMLNCLDSFIDKDKKPTTHGLAAKLLSAPDPEQALHQWVKERVK